MDKRSKVILGLKNVQPVIEPNKYFTDLEKHQIIQELLSSGFSKQAIWAKYTGQKEEHGQLLRWMQKLEYDTGIKTRSPNFASMAKKKITDNKQEDSFENLQLKKRIAELEKQLKDAEMKAIAFSTMVDIAEKEFNIPIRKKYNTKPSKP
jgi:transposase